MTSAWKVTIPKTQHFTNYSIPYDKLISLKKNLQQPYQLFVFIPNSCIDGSNEWCMQSDRLYILCHKGHLYLGYIIFLGYFMS